MSDKTHSNTFNKSDRKKFDEMFSYSRMYNSAGSNACQPQLIHQILMSIIFEHYKQLTKLVDERNCSIGQIKK